MHILFVCSHFAYHRAFKMQVDTISVLTSNKYLVEAEADAKNLYEMMVCVKMEELTHRHEQLADQVNRRRKVDMVMTIAEEYTEVGIKISEYLGVPFFPDAAQAQLVNDKMATRKLLKSHQLDNVPVASVTSAGDIRDFIMNTGFPVILKPNNSCGSRAVTVINEAADISHAMQYFETWAAGQAMIIEQFIKGREFSIEMFSEKGAHHCVTVVEKFKTQKHCVGEGHRIPAPISSPLRQQMTAYGKKVLTVLGVQNGPTHTEIIVSDEDAGISLVETHLRAGGAKIPTLIRLLWDIDILDLWARQFAGERIWPLITGIRDNTDFGVVVFHTPDLKGVMKGVDTCDTLKIEGVAEAGHFKPLGTIINGAACHSGQRASFVVAIGDDPGETLEAARQGAAKLRFTIDSIS